MNHDTKFAITSTALMGDKKGHEKISFENLQLVSWKDAKEVFVESIKDKDDPLIADMLKVIGHLCASLSYLFGRNYTEKGRTPSLLTLIQKGYPKLKGWDLKKDNPTLYGDFEKLNDYFTDVHKHFAESKIQKTLGLDKKKVCHFMDVTQEIWLWFLSKQHNGNIPEYLKHEFKEDFKG